MKKTILATTILYSLSLSASTFNVIIDKEHNEYNIIGFADEIIIGEWADSKPEECSFDLELNDIYYDKDFIQTETCDQEQKRTITVERTYTDETKDIVSETDEFQILTTNDSNNVIGTHLEESCNEVLNFDSSIPSGMTRVKLNSGSELEVFCDMTYDNGGWTRFDKNILSTSTFIKNKYISDGQLSTYNNSYKSGHDAGGSSNGVNAILEIEMGFNYQKFRLLNYKVKDISAANATFDIGTNNAINKNWDASHSTATSGGDVAFGTRDNAKPTASYVNEGANYSSADAVYPFPHTDQSYDNGITSSTFSIKITEAGTQDEFIEVWNGGYIFFK